MTPLIFRKLQQFGTRILLAAGAAAATASAAAQPVVIGEGLSVGWSQFFVADAEKLWEQQGLQAQAITFPSGRLVLDAVIGGRVLLGTAAETPVVFAALNGLPVRIIATTNNGGGKPYEPFTLVASTDIKTVADIKGRRIGYSQGTNAHLYLSRLLDSLGLKFSDITAISLTPSDFVNGAVSGTLDGFIWTEPFVSQALAQGKGKLHSLPSPGLYQGTSSVITLQSTIDKEPELLRKALRALAAADASIKRDPQKAIQAVSTRVNFELPLAQQYWPALNLGLGLDKKALVAELRAQAQWAIDNKLVRPDAKIPDFSTIVVGDFLPAAAR
ncbi:ABC transporter substrate-binding protein [Roseateles violae]|uniref:NrtA/SsuA/CpmA family ABC transporter substrate-binding protein n=1 Tax=Roseateles violae TaxID=3058042 RepID=A0ABT8DPC8_9BURK|nr:NrtA/SsuA/CpmA family ABC transporter substrate-binding protein [Pelomonas sp. PFR6]MDN3919833.1 NrtA/SsuA/CpmA family ABC transporter substrate-binding protein [Pelomonas sp. PFR6]